MNRSETLSSVARMVSKVCQRLRRLGKQCTAADVVVITGRSGRNQLLRRKSTQAASEARLLARPTANSVSSQPVSIDIKASVRKFQRTQELRLLGHDD